MSGDQIAILGILGATVGLFLWGRWRHDVVAVASLLACVVAGVVPAPDAFAGFGHPAVITVACVLVLSRGLHLSGAVDALAGRLLPSEAGPLATIAALVGLGAVLSAFMNNVGAMALLMPVAIQMAAKHDLAPGRILMPLSFGTILGGMTTLIGTPPNLIVSGFRRETGAGDFGMFDFAPVGLAIAVVGVAFLVLVGRRIVPDRKGAGAADFDSGTYLTEVRVTGEGRAAGRTLREVEEMLQKADAQIVSLVRDELAVTAPNPRRKLRRGDILVIEAEPESLATALSSLRLGLEEDVPTRSETEEPAGEATVEEPTGDAKTDRSDSSGEIVLQELVPMPTSAAIGRSASDLELRTRFSLNLLAISRRGRRSIRRLRAAKFRAGDVLLMQGSPEALAAFAGEVGCVPLARRSIRIPNRTRAIVASVVMATAIGVAAFGLLPAAIAFAGGVLVFTLLRVVPPRSVYESIDWSVIVLLSALIPVAGAMASTGAADLVARLLLEGVAQGRPVVSLALVLVVAMTLSDFMNNAATAAVLCPIAISTAAQLGAAADPFLMAVAIGASCAFLTPIGHQNNTLILGPGGFRFGDYWRLGLPMELIVIAIGVPLLLLVWPL